MTPSKKCPQCGTVFHRTPENVYSWGKKIYCSRRCAHEAQDKRRMEERQLGGLKKVGRKKKTQNKIRTVRPSCYTDADWALWNLKDSVTDQCQRDKYRDEHPCECCLPKHMVKMRTAGKCDKYAKLQKL